MFMQAVICFNPFEAGRGLSTIDERKPPKYTISFNPFGTGRDLSTIKKIGLFLGKSISIPLEQGRVFRLRGWFGALMDKA